MIALWKALKRARRELVGHGGKYSSEYGSIQLPKDSGTCHIHVSCCFLIMISVLGLIKDHGLMLMLDLKPHVPSNRRHVALR